MGLVTKIFIVIMLVLALFATALQISIFAKREQYQQQLFLLAGQVAETKEENAKLEQQLSNEKEDYEKVISGLRDENSRQKDSIEEFQIKVTQATELNNRLMGENGNIKSQLNQLVERLSQVNQDLHKANGELEKITAERDSAKKNAEEFRGRKEELERMMNYALIEIESLKTQQTNLNSQIAKLKKELNDAIARGGDNRGGSEVPRNTDDPMPPSTGQSIQAEVSTVRTDPTNGVQYVVINAGKEKKVRTGQIFSIFRDGAFVGKVKISKIDSYLSYGESMQDYSVSPIKMGDSAVYMAGR